MNDRVIFLSTDDIMRIWRPGSHDEPWTWTDEIEDLKSQGWLQRLNDDLVISGDMPPILLGGDGRVWDGHHRIIGAYMQGLRKIPCLFAFIPLTLAKD